LHWQINFVHFTLRLNVTGVMDFGKLREKSVKIVKRFENN